MSCHIQSETESHHVTQWQGREAERCVGSEVLWTLMQVIGSDLEERRRGGGLPSRTGVADCGPWANLAHRLFPEVPLPWHTATLAGACTLYGSFCAATTDSSSWHGDHLTFQAENIDILSLYRKCLPALALKGVGVKSSFSRNIINARNGLSFPSWIYISASYLVC